VTARCQRQQYNRHYPVGNLITLILAIAGLILVTLGFALSDPWPVCAKQLIGWAGIGWARIFISVAGIVRQYRETRSFTYDFTESDWTPTDDGIVLEIPKAKHKKAELLPKQPCINLLDLVGVRKSCAEYTQRRQEQSVLRSPNLFLGAYSSNEK
jgi:hypothetical protein